MKQRLYDTQTELKATKAELKSTKTAFEGMSAWTTGELESLKQELKVKLTDAYDCLKKYYEYTYNYIRYNFKRNL